MTRINVVPVQELTGPHLVAEYRELPRVFSLLLKRLGKGLGRPPNQPQAYTLGTGHILFFYDKLHWLAKRHVELVEEMKARGYKPMFERSLRHKYCDVLPMWCWGDYEPTVAALAINRSRIAKRLAGDKSP